MLTGDTWLTLVTKVATVTYTLSPLRIVRNAFGDSLFRPNVIRQSRDHFLSPQGMGSHFGVFDSFAAARDWLPPSPEFDLDVLAVEYIRVRTKRVYAYDYPVMWWLDRAMRDGATRVLDIGGSVGVHYYAYRRHIAMPDGLAWHVVEVPTIADIGKNMAARQGATPLSFTTHLQDALAASRDDVLLAAGVIQYLDEGRPDRLLKLGDARPTHLLLNKVPLYGGEDFVTTQNIGGGAFSPVHVYNRDRFIKDIEALGYTLMDEWAVAERSMNLPGLADRSFPTFTGLYFVAIAGAQRIEPAARQIQ
ncbi:methyltransferase, TIGR04325 family [Variovorax rhizosphaerae]|uniref:Methyltransferase, TIGR04325 family n=1 Tax=Variovorax rhizosphaerae TaxID=1836200 RepID=A0ABU8WKB8_9BURK